ncbi:hypothetical protein IJ670_08380, partial [bacterium]|nr:hypothetical protein [bacterium]
MSLSHRFNISLGSLKNNQYALSVVSHNIAKMNTEGYYRQRVNFSENRILQSGTSVLSQINSLYGASIDSLSGTVNNGLVNAVVDSNADANYYNTLADGLGTLEDIGNDLGDTGLSALLGDFYSAAAKLEQFPTDMALRQQYVYALNDVCEKFNLLSNRYDNLESDTITSAKTETGYVNSLLSSLAELNEAHVKNGNASETQAQINQTLQELSNYVDVKYDTNESGSYNVYIGKTLAVKGNAQLYDIDVVESGDSNNPLQFALIDKQDPSKVITNEVNEGFSSGKFKSYLDLANQSQTRTFRNVQDMKTALDSAADAFKTTLNEIQTHSETYTDASGQTQRIVAASLETVNNELRLTDNTTEILEGNGAKNLKVV